MFCDEQLGTCCFMSVRIKDASTFIPATAIDRSSEVCTPCLPTYNRSSDVCTPCLPAYNISLPVCALQ